MSKLLKLKMDLTRLKDFSTALSQIIDGCDMEQMPQALIVTTLQELLLKVEKKKLELPQSTTIKLTPPQAVAYVYGYTLTGVHKDIAHLCSTHVMQVGRLMKGFKTDTGL